MGYVYYGNYAEYYEVARVEMLRSLGMDYAGMEASGVKMPVLELTCKYIRPALYDQELTIKTTIENLPGIRIHFKYEVFGPEGDLINIGTTTLVFVDMARNRPCQPPEDFMKRLQKYFN
jgi:acyl-CoA thioester hydrolase